MNPAPLTVGLAGRDPVLGSLQFVLTNLTASPISVSSVEFTVEVGTESSDLTPSTANVGTSISDSTSWLIPPVSSPADLPPTPSNRRPEILFPSLQGHPLS